MRRLVSAMGDNKADQRESWRVKPDMINTNASRVLI
jgi:hypothetical protein